ncbi:hypothetical protein ACFFUT_15590 [Pseudohalocynthiibacter aestuariivivens]|jgi:hypothetical protein|uniref:Peptide methionine sulfoxide reductase n=1 Tax=Pseudohalocynthiibacter aestuariivivens TaxID=1591409 RepID=A0ABV5JIK1_9RHOB|nr:MULTISPECIES: hypothetical protein [Pseudohalocynthiibacter]MBS9717512.1 hypothetical protein [Pseudohalocynthiibacter aestuariivivens]MCK0102152.1 hypothetical protein [Pseudohalocynthiibacter sp. F2068]
MKAFLAAFDALPFGTHQGRYQNRPYVLTKSRFAGGRSQKLIAEELGGPDYISLNLYQLSSGKSLLKPCEMPEEKVISFVRDVIVSK